MDFTPIETQAELDAIVAKRLSKQKEQYEAQLAKQDADFDKERKAMNKLMEENELLKSEAEKVKSDGAKTIADLENQIKDHEIQNLKLKIATEKGLPLEATTRLTGSTEEEIRADAENLGALIGSGRTEAPVKEVNQSSGISGYEAMLDELEF